MQSVTILISDKLRKVLSEIQNESEVARLLLKSEHDKNQLVESPINYICVSTDDESKISYLSQDRIKQIESVDERWTSSKRYHVKPGSFVGKLFKDISSKEVEKFTNLYRAQIRPVHFKFHIVKDEAIKYWYHYDNYADQTGSLGSSCMKSEHYQRGLDFYVENDVKMLIMLNDDDLLMGRALLWDCTTDIDSYSNVDQPVGKIKIMDRIYTICDEDYAYYFKQWANKNGYRYKFEQRWNNTLEFDKSGKKERLNIKIDIQNATDHYPYMDTFKWVDKTNKAIFNYRPHSNVRVCCSSDGTTCAEDYLLYDDIDQTYLYNGDTTFLDYLNLRTGMHNVSYSEVNSVYILIKHSEYVEDIKDYIFKGEWSHLNNLEAIETRREFLKRKSEEKKDENCKEEKSVVYSRVASRIYEYGDTTTGQVETEVPSTDQETIIINYDFDFGEGESEVAPVSESEGQVESTEEISFA